MITNIIIFIGLVILSIAAGYSQGDTTGWTVLGVGIILIGLIEKYER